MTAVLAPTPQSRAPLRPQRASPLLLSYAWYAPSLSTYDMFAARDRRVLLNARDPVVSGSPALFNRFRRLVNEKRPIGPSAGCPDANVWGPNGAGPFSKFSWGRLEFNPSSRRRAFSGIRMGAQSAHLQLVDGFLEGTQSPGKVNGGKSPPNTSEPGVIRPGTPARHWCRLSLA